MESHRLSHHTPRSSHDGLFGVRVQVQGFKGQPYVVLNSSGPESHRDVSVVTQQGGYDPDTSRRRVDERCSPPGSRPSSASSMLHYQKHPEILRPYDPQSNSLNFLASAASVDGPEQLKRGQTAPRSRARIPLPAEGPEDLRNEESEAKAPSLARQLPARSPNAVETESVLSVGQLISQFNSSQRRGRGGPRNRLDPEQCQRSRSLDSSRTSDSSSSSSSSSRAESAGGMYPPGSARARLLGGQAPLVRKKEEKTLSLPEKEHNGREAARLRASRLRQGAEKPAAFTSPSNANERDAQVTPTPPTHRQADFKKHICLQDVL